METFRRAMKDAVTSPRILWIPVGLMLLFMFLCGVLYQRWEVTATPVNVYLEVEPGEMGTIQLALDAEDGPARTLGLIPVEKNHQGNWAVWTTELPPRGHYQPEFRFEGWPAGLRDRVRLSAVEYLKLSPERESLQKLGPPDFEWVDNRLVQTRPVHRQASYLSFEFISAMFTASGLLLVGLGLVAAGLMFPHSVSGTGGLGEAKRWEWSFHAQAGLIVLLVLCAGIHYYLLARSAPGFWPADSTTYMLKGIRFLHLHHFDAGGHEFELNRMPGYPFLIALAFWLMQQDLHAVIALQSVIFLGSLSALIWQIRSFCRPVILMVAVPLCLLSPAAVWACRQIATEGTFAASFALGLALFYGYWKTGHWRRWIYFGAFMATVVVAILIRPNGILLLALPGCLLVGYGFRWLWEGNWRDLARPPHIVWLAVWALPFVAAWWTVDMWSERNERHRGYRHPTDLAPVVWANAPFYSGMVDLRYTQDPQEYEWVIRSRRDQGYFFHGWSLRNYYFRQITQEYRIIHDESVSELAEATQAFADANAALISWPDKMVAIWRAAHNALWIPDRRAFSQDLVQLDLRLNAAIESASREETIRQRLNWASRGHGSIKLKQFERQWFHGAFNLWVGIYPWFYKVLAVAAIAALLVAVWRRQAQALPPFILFYLNLILIIVLQYVLARYIQVLDFCLVLGVAMVVSSLTARVSPEPAREKAGPPAG